MACSDGSCTMQSIRDVVVHSGKNFVALVSHLMTLAPASRLEHREFKITLDSLISWTLANATLVMLEYNLFLFQWGVVKLRRVCSSYTCRSWLHSAVDATELVPAEVAPVQMLEKMFQLPSKQAGN